jgi:Tfp pilus assembly protein PilF
MQAPKDAKKAFEHGQKAAQKEKWAEAQQHFQKAVDAYPQYADAWASLGIVCLKLEQPEQARKAFEQSLAADPKYILPYSQLAQMAVGDKDWTRVAQLTDKALELNAYEFPAAYYYNSVAYYELKKFDRAEKSARTARRLDSQYRIPKIDLILSSLLLQRQDFNAAAQQLREFLKHSPAGPDAERARVALADTEQHIASKTGGTSVANEQPKQ